MWTIGIAGAWYEGIHHRSLEKAHAAAAEVKRVELKEKHTFGESPLAPTTTSLEFFSSLPLTFRARSRPLAAMKALEDHDQQLVEAEEFIRISKAAIEGARLSNFGASGSRHQPPRRKTHKASDKVGERFTDNVLSSRHD